MHSSTGDCVLGVGAVTMISVNIRLLLLLVSCCWFCVCWEVESVVVLAAVKSWFCSADDAMLLSVAAWPTLVLYLSILSEVMFIEKLVSSTW